MRILHLLNDSCNLGNGIVNVAIDLACLQRQSGHTVAVAAGPPKNGVQDYGSLLKQYSVQQFSLDQTRTPHKLLAAVWRYRKIIKDFQPTIVHAHMMTGIVLAKALQFKSNYRLVSTVHSDFQHSAILMGLADQVIAVSHAVATKMQNRGIPQHKFRVVHNGTIGSPRQPPLQSYTPVSLKRPAIVTVAGLYHRKGIAELITEFNQVAQAIPTANLYLVGDGPDRHQFETQAKASPFAHRIHFEGFQPEPWRYLRSTDAFVLPSRHEAFGLVLSEAREAGCAIVANRVDGIPEALDNGQAGLLISPHNSNSFAKALIRLLTNKKYLAHWQQMSQQNLKKLDAHRVCQETLAIYQELTR
ncbi:glycosyltransferase family 4 protein [Leptothoe spongobia]|uniref:Glycosyltransferase family 4 protein n=1 Tax=Leptothoe spongobia TAU-MAC 1115 TaxID=1967444 RepID=A0A947GJT1_9CYAN|nr:glycosyltransferase family 4 protein [Leptothoe spongobia]MBT9317260.1 glycosyltransferase family 4 protein [Leptothoe spongobia TAU-MAC 1115]